MTPVNAVGGAICHTRPMIAQLPPDKMPPPRPEGIPRFQRLFREAAGLNFDKADLKRYEDFIDLGCCCAPRPTPRPAATS